MKKLRPFVFRLIISIIVAGLLFVVGYIIPARITASEKQNTASELNAYAAALTAAHQRLSESPDPSVITSRSIGSARDYIQQVLTVAPYLNTEAFTAPKPVTALPFFQSTKSYNTFVSSENFKQTLLDADTALQDSRDLLTYHSSIMQALANILEYQPAEDTNTTDQERLLSSIQLTGGGLEKTTLKLKQTKEYDDPGLDRVYALLQDIEVVRNNYQQAVESRQDTATVRMEYISTISKAQDEMIVNRSKFWTDKSVPALANLSNTSRLIAPYLITISNL